MIASIFGQAILGLLLADLLSGIVHWWMDRVGKETWPILGPWLIAPNQHHHEKPLAFCDGTFWYRNGTNFAVAAIVGITWYLVLGFSFALASAVIATAWTNEIHRLTHQPKTANRLIVVMQEIGLLQSPKGHARHHRPPQTTNYCPITDWVNPALEAMQVWSRLERLFKITPA